MPYLAGQHPSLPVHLNHQGIRFQLYQAPDAELLASIADQFDRLEDGRRLTTHQSAFGHCFIKTTPIRSLSRRLRITFGLPSPGKGLDWELVELVNHLQAEALGIPCPRLLGYGYRTRAGLVDALCLIYEYLDGQCDGAEWLGRHPERAPELLATLCEAVLDLHGKRAYPLDLWLGNLMLSPQDPSRLTFIDFESCCFGTSPHIDAVLGLIFGQLYYGTLKATFRDFLSESQFDAIVRPYRERLAALDTDQFEAAYQAAKHTIVNRKARRRIFRQGLRGSKLLQAH